MADSISSHETPFPPQSFPIHDSRAPKRANSGNTVSAASRFRPNSTIPQNDYDLLARVPLDLLQRRRRLLLDPAFYTLFQHACDRDGGPTSSDGQARQQLNAFFYHSSQLLLLRGQRFTDLLGEMVQLLILRPDDTQDILDVCGSGALQSYTAIAHLTEQEVYEQHSMVASNEKRHSNDSGYGSRATSGLRQSTQALLQDLKQPATLSNIPSPDTTFFGQATVAHPYTVDNVSLSANASPSAGVDPTSQHPTPSGDTRDEKYRVPCPIANCTWSVNSKDFERYWAKHVNKHGKPEFSCMHPGCGEHLETEERWLTHHKIHKTCENESTNRLAISSVCFALRYSRHALVCANCPERMGWTGEDCWDEWVRHCVKTEGHKRLLADGKFVMPENDPDPERSVRSLTHIRDIVWSSVEPRLWELQKQQDHVETANNYARDDIKTVLHGLLSYPDEKIKDRPAFLERVARLVHSCYPIASQASPNKPMSQHSKPRTPRSGTISLSRLDADLPPLPTSAPTNTRSSIAIPLQPPYPIGPPAFNIDAYLNLVGQPGPQPNTPVQISPTPPELSSNSQTSRINLKDPAVQSHRFWDSQAGPPFSTVDSTQAFPASNSAFNDVYNGTSNREPVYGGALEYYMGHNDLSFDMTQPGLPNQVLTDPNSQLHATQDPGFDPVYQNPRSSPPRNSSLQ